MKISIVATMLLIWATATAIHDHFYQRPGVNMQYTLTGRMVVTGVLDMSHVLYEKFEEVTPEIIAQAAYSHCQNYIKNRAVSFNAPLIATQATWSGLCDSVNQGATTSLGVVIDASSVILHKTVTPNDWSDFIDEMYRYWTVTGQTVTCSQVNSLKRSEELIAFDARASGATATATADKASSSLTFVSVCGNPVDLRKFFTGNTPTVPSNSYSC